MAETASETASSLQLIRTLINPNQSGRTVSLPAITTESLDQRQDNDSQCQNDNDIGSVVEEEMENEGGNDEASQFAETLVGTNFISNVPSMRSRVDFISEVAPSRAQTAATSYVTSTRPYSPAGVSQRELPQRAPQAPSQAPQQRPSFYEQEEGAYYHGAQGPAVASEADNLRSKHTMLIELHYLKGQGALLTKEYTIHDDLGDVHFELMRQRNLVDCSQTVEQWMVYIIVGIYIIEWLNSILGSPLYFAGVGEYMSKNIKSIRLPLQRCYHRYIHRPSNNPIWDVVKALVVSLIAYHLQMMLVTNIAGPNTARNTNVAAPSNIMSMLPILMSALGGGGLAGSSGTSSGTSTTTSGIFDNISSMFSAATGGTRPPAQAAAAPQHVPFGVPTGGFGEARADPFDELQMPPPPPLFRR